jgi:HAD superfamily hydrolase (TIGR01459 family)
VSERDLAPVVVLDGIAALADRYDGFILDVWGVLHNGVAPYPGVVEALQHLADAGKSVALLSNAPMRAATVAARIEKIGVPRPLFQQIMTSGEEVWRNLSHRTDPLYAKLGRHCLWLGPSRHRGMLSGLNLVQVETPDQASFILNTGPDDLDDDATLYRAMLEDAAARGLTMICANADLHVMHGTTLIACAGMLAKRYEEIGGTVRWHGKPYPSVYDACLGLLGIADKRRILCVGDSLRTDVAGAIGVGIDSALVASGIHAAEFGIEPDRPLDQARVQALLAGQPRPRYVIDRLIW